MARRSQWQRRYDESIARERANPTYSDDMTGAELAGFESSLWLPGWLGVIVLAITATAAFIRRRGR